MSGSVNHIKKIEEKLRIYNKPFIEFSLLQEILIKFAPNYEVKELNRKGLLSPIVRGKVYFNLLSTEKSTILPTTILAQYGQGKTYMLGGLYLYNQYSLSQQVANKITVYNTSIHGERMIAGVPFIFKKQRGSFFRGIEQIDAQGYGTYNRMIRERALIQLIKDTQCNIEYSNDIYREIRHGNISKDILLQLSQHNTSKNTQYLVQQFLKKGAM